MKYIELKTPNGKYKLPLIIVATNRTNYYSGTESFEKDSEQWREEMSYIMNDASEGIDWLMNNMDIEDIKPFMVKVEDVSVDDDWFYDSDNFDSFED